jgi:hypothetical protein
VLDITTVVTISVNLPPSHCSLNFICLLGSGGWILDSIQTHVFWMSGRVGRKGQVELGETWGCPVSQPKSFLGPPRDKQGSLDGCEMEESPPTTCLSVHAVTGKLFQVQRKHPEF